MNSRLSGIALVSAALMAGVGCGGGSGSTQDTDVTSGGSTGEPPLGACMGNEVRGPSGRLFKVVDATYHANYGDDLVDISLTDTAGASCSMGGPTTATHSFSLKTKVSATGPYNIGDEILAGSKFSAFNDAGTAATAGTITISTIGPTAAGTFSVTIGGESYTGCFSGVAVCP